MKRICYFGIYDSHYGRNRVLIKGLRENGYEVVECNVNPKENAGISKYVELYRKGREARKQEFSYVIVGFPGHTVMWLAYLLFGRKVIFDAFISQFDSNVLDRASYSRWSFRGMRDWLLDWYSVHLAQFVLLDTNAHIDFFVREFGRPRSAYVRVFVGTDDGIFKKVPEPESVPFRVHFHGDLIPLHGFDYILDAARRLRQEDICFVLIGTKRGRFARAAHFIEKEGLQEKVFLKERVPYEQLPSLISTAHIALGIFGESEKAARVIPNKVYEYLAMGKAVITRESPAARELLSDRENVLFCRAADGSDLAEKILLLKSDSALRAQIAERGYALFSEQLTPRVIARRLMEEVGEGGDFRN